MNKYEVVVTPEAEAGIIAAFNYIDQDSPANAEKWLRRLYRQIDALEQMPERCPLAPESEYLHEELRHLLFKSYRVIFRIEKTPKIVRVLYVRHGKRQTITYAGSQPTSG